MSFVVNDTPQWLTTCNCSACRRYAALWLHTDPANVTLAAPEDGLISYVWGDHLLAFNTCKTCGCTTHWSALNGDNRMALNMRMADPDSIKTIRVRQFDGADQWRFLD